MQQLLARGRGAALRPVPSQCLPALPCTPSTLRTHRQRYMSLQATPQEEVTTTEASSSECGGQICSIVWRATDMNVQSCLRSCMLRFP